MISLYPYYLSAEYYFDKRIEKMEEYYQEAKELAAFYNTCNKVFTNPTIPVSNMFHVHFEIPKEKVETILADICHETGVGLSSYIREVSTSTSYFEVSIGDLYSLVPKSALKNAFELLNKKLNECS